LLFWKFVQNMALLYCVNLIIIMHKAKAVRNTNLLFFFVSLHFPWFYNFSVISTWWCKIGVSLCIFCIWVFLRFFVIIIEKGRHHIWICRIYIVNSAVPNVIWAYPWATPKSLHLYCAERRFVFFSAVLFNNMSVELVDRLWIHIVYVFRVYIIAADSESFIMTICVWV
jgi:Zn-dependent protease with chaperone function